MVTVEELERLIRRTLASLRSLARATRSARDADPRERSRAQRGGPRRGRRRLRARQADPTARASDSGRSHLEPLTPHGWERTFGRPSVREAAATGLALPGPGPPSATRARLRRQDPAARSGKARHELAAAPAAREDWPVARSGRASRA